MSNFSWQLRRLSLVDIWHFYYEIFQKISWQTLFGTMTQHKMRLWKFVASLDNLLILLYTLPIIWAISRQPNFLIQEKKETLLFLNRWLLQEEERKNIRIDCCVTHKVTSIGVCNLLIKGTLSLTSGFWKQLSFLFYFKGLKPKRQCTARYFLTLWLLLNYPFLF